MRPKARFASPGRSGGVLLAAAGLTALDQGVKLLILRFAPLADMDLLGPLVRFRPVQNTNLSWGGNYFALLSNPFLMNALNVLALLLLALAFHYYRATRQRKSLWGDLLFVLSFAGCLCSLVDKLFWGGSLDFIQLPGLFTFDLKDCYLSGFVVLALVLTLRHGDEISLREVLRFYTKRAKE